MKAFDSFLRAAAIACVLVAGSCAAATNDAQSIASDGAVNHPIAVEPNFREIKLQFAGGGQGLGPYAAAQFDNFLADYSAHGNGSLGISVPNGPRGSSRRDSRVTSSDDAGITAAISALASAT